MKCYVSGIYKTMVIDLAELVIDLGDFSEHVGKQIDGFEGAHGGYGIGKKMSRKKL